MSYSFSSKSKNIIDGVNNQLQAVCHRAIEISSIDFGIPSSGGMRTAQEQNRLFTNGKSKCDGYDLLSYHQSGNAIDVYAYVDGKASWKVEHLNIVALAVLAAASELGVKLKWGGHFKGGWDKPHFELIEVKL